MPSSKMTTLSNNFSDGEFLEYTGSESGLASPSIDTTKEGDCVSLESWISAWRIDVGVNLHDNGDENDEDYVASDCDPVSYSPTALAQSFKDLGIHEQVVHKGAVTNKKLTKTEAALLYAFAAYFCLNGPVGFRTKIHLNFECKEPLNIKHRGKVSMRDIFGTRITHLEFAGYVSAVKKSLPEGIACPMTKCYGEYFPNLAFMLAHLDSGSSFTGNRQIHPRRTLDEIIDEIAPV
ncbi:uncharacterized protein V1513DRAFT_197994 [Lipomyces chichibuensis]|uniref:uncharacterized protein n=1 Tax=Lipomyces chichibuensis TaxID=1546026 RepID=UPI0033435406